MADMMFDLVCQHCGETCVPFEEIAEELQRPIQSWGETYEPIHEVAHWDDQQRKRGGNYDDSLEEAAAKVERLLAEAGKKIAPQLLEHFPAVVWEDQDECLGVRPEDVEL